MASLWPQTGHNPIAPSDSDLHEPDLEHAILTVLVVAAAYHIAHGAGADKERIAAYTEARTKLLAHPEAMHFLRSLIQLSDTFNGYHIRGWDVATSVELSRRMTEIYRRVRKGSLGAPEYGDEIRQILEELQLPNPGGHRGRKLELNDAQIREFGGPVEAALTKAGFTITKGAMRKRLKKPPPLRFRPVAFGFGIGREPPIRVALRATMPENRNVERAMAALRAGMVEPRQPPTQQPTPDTATPTLAITILGKALTEAQSAGPTNEELGTCVFTAAGLTSRLNLTRVQCVMLGGEWTPPTST